MGCWTRGLTVLAASLMLSFSSVSAWAIDQTGKVRSVDPHERLVILEDGTQLWIVKAISLDLFVLQRTVKVTYDERDGKKWVRAVELVN